MDAVETRRRELIRDLLLGEKPDSGAGGFWAPLHGSATSWADANRFFAGAVLDFQILADTAWRNGERLVDEIAPDPEGVWAWIADQPKEQWTAMHDEMRLHRFAWMHAKLHDIATRLCDDYQGDPRNIWAGRTADDVLKRVQGVAPGDAVPRMIVGALKDSQVISGSSDIKPDVHASRTIGRLVTGSAVSPEEAIRLARELNPEDPWELDYGLFTTGKFTCKRNEPQCPRCTFVQVCAAAKGAEQTDAVAPRATLDSVALTEMRVPKRWWSVARGGVFDTHVSLDSDISMEALVSSPLDAAIGYLGEMQMNWGPCTVFRVQIPGSDAHVWRVFLGPKRLGADDSDLVGYFLAASRIGETDYDSQCSGRGETLSMVFRPTLGLPLLRAELGLPEGAPVSIDVAEAAADVLGPFGASRDDSHLDALTGLVTDALRAAALVFGEAGANTRLWPVVKKRNGRFSTRAKMHIYGERFELTETELARELACDTHGRCLDPEAQRRWQEAEKKRVFDDDGAELLYRVDSSFDWAGDDMRATIVVTEPTPGERL